MLWGTIKIYPSTIKEKICVQNQIRSRPDITSKAAQTPTQRDAIDLGGVNTGIPELAATGSSPAKLDLSAGPFTSTPGLIPGGHWPGLGITGRPPGLGSFPGPSLGPPADGGQCPALCCGLLAGPPAGRRPVCNCQPLAVRFGCDALFIMLYIWGAFTPQSTVVLSRT